jgi:prophage regulatory protein
MEADRLVRERERREITGVPTSSWYELQSLGLAPRPVRLSKHAVAWPYGELAAVNAARIAGKSDGEIRKLVNRLVAARTRALERLEAR